MSESLWQISNVFLSGRPRARLQDVSVSISSKPTALLGPSGSGKTSLLNLLVGFEQADRGTIEFQGPINEARLPLYWVPHNGGLWPHLTVREHVATVQTATDENQAELLTQFDLEHLAEQRPESLSQGEKSRLTFVRALAAKPAVLLMDEPLVHVDPTRSLHYWDLIRDYCRVYEINLVFSTHQPETALRESEEVICLKEGRLLFQGKTADLYQAPPTEELARYLGPTNWFEASEAIEWLQNKTTASVHHRPENIKLEQVEEGPFEVGQYHQLGNHQEIELVEPSSNKRRRFWTRSQNNTLQRGSRVIIKTLLLLLMFCLPGCENSTDALLPVQEERYWMLPMDELALPAPRGLTMSEKQELIVLDNAGRVLVYSPERKLVKQWKMPESDVGKPEGVIQLQDGRIAVADTHYHRVVFFDSEGNVLSMIGKLGEEQGQFIYPVALTEDNDQNIYVCEYGGNDRIQKFDKSGQWLLTFGKFGLEADMFQRPSGLVWHDDHIYIADAINNRIQIFTDSGQHIKSWGSVEHPLELNYPYDIALGPKGLFYVVEYGSGRVSQIDQDGKLLARYGTTGMGAKQFNTPWGLTVDAQSNVYIADTGNRRIMMLDQ